MKRCHGFDAVTCSNGEGDAQSDPSRAIVGSNQLSLTAVVHHQGKICVSLLLVFIFLNSILENFVCNPGKIIF
jgi:hypothetical protein